MTFERLDARRLPFEGEFDAVISLCQGAFGLAAGGTETALDPDGVVLAGIARALKPGRSLAMSAFSSYFQVRYLQERTTFDAERGVAHEVTSIKDEAGVDAPADLWTTCFTPRELRLLAQANDLVVEDLWSVEPGRLCRRSGRPRASRSSSSSPVDPRLSRGDPHAPPGRSSRRRPAGPLAWRPLCARIRGRIHLFPSLREEFPCPTRPQ